MRTLAAVALRDMTPADVPICFEHQLDPEAGRMAAFTSKDGRDRDAYVARWTRLLAEGSVCAKMILAEGEVVGTIASWGPPEDRQVTYWIWRTHWRRGLATSALSEYLKVYPARPLFGTAAHDNGGSLRVLEKCGFKRVGTARGFANARGEEIDEVILKLE